MVKTKLGQLTLAAFVSSTFALAGCGGSSGTVSAPPPSNPPPSSPPPATPPPTTTPAPTPTPPPATSAKVSGPMDPVQDQAVTGVMANSLAPNLPDPLDSTVICISEAINTLVDIPDAALVLAAAGAAPDVDVTTAQIQLAAETFVEQMQNLAFALNGDGSCDEDHPATPTNPFDPVVDQFAGTPLEPLVDALVGVAAVLEAQGASEDPDLTALTSALQPAMAQVFVGMTLIPADVYNAPVVGPALSVLAQALLDVRNVLDDIGTFSAAGTEAGIETLVSNLLNGILLNVVPVADIDAATGENVSGEIATGIATLTSTFGNGLSSVISPLFLSGLPGTIAPVVNPVNGVIASMAGNGSLFSSPLDGDLAAIAGNGVDDPADVLMALLLAGDSNLPSNAIVAALTGVTDANPAEQLELLGTPGLSAEALLASIVNFRDIGFSPTDAVYTSVDGALGGLLDDLLGGLL